MEADHYRTVDFQQPIGSRGRPRHEVVTKGTLRDAPNRFVIGKRQAVGWVQDIHL